jgi:hypothetical protein
MSCGAQLYDAIRAGAASTLHERLGDSAAMSRQLTLLAERPESCPTISSMSQGSDGVAFSIASETRFSFTVLENKLGRAWSFIPPGPSLNASEFS